MESWYSLKNLVDGGMLQFSVHLEWKKLEMFW